MPEDTYTVPLHTSRHYGACQYCGEEIISKPMDIMTCFVLKMKTGEAIKWHTDCYTEALAKALLGVRKI